MNFKDIVLKALDEAKSSYERRIIVVSKKEGHENLIRKIRNIFKNKKVLYIGYQKDEFKDIVRNLDAYSFEDTQKVLGRTYDFLILDLRENLSPNDIGRVINVVRGGGLIFLLTPRFKEWLKIKNKFQERLVTYPYTIDDVKSRFVSWFIRCLKESAGVYIIEEDKIIKKPKGVLKPITKKRKPINVPENIFISKRIYRLCLTQEQVDTIKILEDFFNERKKSSFILIANRGRGKSALLGLFLAGIVERLVAENKRYNICVTSPERENVETLYEFLEKGLEALNIKYKIENGEYVIERCSIRYKKPLYIFNENYNLVVVDEAAGISVPLLFKIVEKYKKTIFSSTIHGYEGAGRGFSVRFLKELKEKGFSKIYEKKIDEPIRYASNDLIEKWLFRTLLLDAEPAELSDEDYIALREKRISYQKPNMDEWITKREEEMRQFVGIYILAHYRNRPNDIAILLDAPHHDARVLKVNNKIVNSLQIAFEGNVSEDEIEKYLQGYKPRGNILPDVITKHYRIKEFAKLKGIRIVRIATHPNVMRHGLGSFMLNELTKEFEGTVDYIGTSFGASELLLKFWIKNGFIPLHLSFERNPISGEYSVIVVKPLSDKAKNIVKMLNYEFLSKILDSVSEIQYDIEPSVLYLLVKTKFKFKPKYQLNVTDIQRKRFKGFVEGLLTYESIADIFRNLVKFYFLDTSNQELEEFEEKIMLTKTILSKSWRRVSELLNVSEFKVKTVIKDVAKYLYSKYLA